MVRSHSFAWILVSLLSLALAAPLQADITPSGDVDPTDYSWWTGSGDSSTKAYIGKTAYGSVTVNLGSDLSSRYGYVGHDSGSTGVVTVDGSGSTWTNSDDLYVGRSGQGTLNITNGGAVSNSGGYIGRSSGSTGEVTVDGSGSTWTNSCLYVGYYGQGTLNITNGGAVNVTYETRVARNASAAGEIHFDSGTLTTRSLLAGATQLIGTGTINTHGLVSDVDLVFDSTHGLNQTLTLNSQTGQNITINLTQGNMGKLGAGYAGEGTLAIRDGVSVESSTGYIGYKAGATGVVTVDGSGSTWTSSSSISVGIYGQGTLNITNGGAVSNSGGYIGDGSGSTGVVTVDGSGSTWTSGALYVGIWGHGTLNITNGGAVVSNDRGYIGYFSGSTSEVTVDGSGSTWTNSGDLYVGGNYYDGHGTLNITNGGAVNVTGDTWVARNTSAAGEIHFEGGTLTTGSLLSEPTWLTGTGTINTHGLVSDVDLLFDSAHGPNQTLALNSQPDQNITINLTQDSTGDLGAGYAGEGTMAIRDGVSVDSYYGYIGYKAGATGEVTVDDAGSTWTCDRHLYVGRYGQGTLNITNGGTVSSTSGCISCEAGSTGVVTVDGSGSTWANNHLCVGSSGQGTLNITNGGTVSNNDKGYIGYWSGSTGEVTVDGSGSTWINSDDLYIGDDGQGTLNITNGGLLEVGETLNVRGTGTLNIGAAGQVTVGEKLSFAQDSALLAEPGATIHMTGSAFENTSTNLANLAGLGNLTLIFEGGSEGVDPFEVACEDMGAFMAGYQSNFALGTLQLGGDAGIGQLQLVDDYDNRPDWAGSEALYVENLILGSGSTLDLNGLNLYYLNFTDLGGSIDLNGGSITQVPEPATLGILISGFIVGCFSRRRN